MPGTANGWEHFYISSYWILSYIVSGHSHSCRISNRHLSQLTCASKLVSGVHSMACISCVLLILLAGILSLNLTNSNCFYVRMCPLRGAWVVQSVKRLTSAQVVISQSRTLFVSWSPASALCWQLRAWSLLQILCLLLSAPPQTRGLSLSQK